MMEVTPGLPLVGIGRFGLAAEVPFTLTGLPLVFERCFAGFPWCHHRNLSKEHAEEVGCLVGPDVAEHKDVHAAGPQATSLRTPPLLSPKLRYRAHAGLETSGCSCGGETTDKVLPCSLKCRICSVPSQAGCHALSTLVTNVVAMHPESVPFQLFRELDGHNSLRTGY